MHNVLMVFEKFPPFNLSGSSRPYYFAKHLPEFGYAPHVVAAEVPAGHDRDDQLVRELEGLCDVSRTNLWTFGIGRVVATVRGLKRPSVAPGGSPAAASSVQSEPSSPEETSLAFRAMWAVAWRVYWYANWGCPATLMGLRAHLRKRFDLVWVSGPHFRNLFAAYWLSVFLRKPLIVDLRDPWTYGSLWSPRTRGVAKAEVRWAKRILHRAERIVFTSPLTMEEMRERFPGRPASRMCTITNGFTGGDVKPLRESHADKCVFRYIGALNERRRPDVILEALREASADPELRNDVRLQFIGGMAGHERKIGEFGLSEQVEDVGRCSRADSIRYMWGSDVNMLLQTIPRGQDAISGKIYEYLGARKPILAVVSEAGGDAWLLRKTDAGTVVPFTQPKQVAAEITRLWKLWKQGALADSIGHIDLAAFSWPRLTRELALVFDDVLHVDRDAADEPVR